MTEKLISEEELKWIQKLFGESMGDAFSRFGTMPFVFKFSYISLHLYILCYWLLVTLMWDHRHILPNAFYSSDQILREIIISRLILATVFLAIMNMSFYLKIGFRFITSAMLLYAFYVTVSVVSTVFVLSDSHLTLSDILFLLVRFLMLIGVWSLYRSSVFSNQ